MILISILSISLALITMSLQAHRMEHTIGLNWWKGTISNTSDLLEYATRWTILIIISKKLLKQAFLYYKLRKTFSKFYNRFFDLVKQINSSSINLIEEGLSHSHFYRDFLKKSFFK